MLGGGEVRGSSCFNLQENTLTIQLGFDYFIPQGSQQEILADLGLDPTGIESNCRFLQKIKFLVFFTNYFHFFIPDNASANAKM